MTDKSLTRNLSSINAGRTSAEAYLGVANPGADRESGWMTARIADTRAKQACAGRLGDLSSLAASK